MDHEEFRQAGYKIIDEIVDYYKTTDQLKPTTNVQPGYLPPLMPKSAPEEPESFDKIHQDFKDLVVPGLTHWQSSNFFGYFPSTSSYPSMLAEMYSNMFNSQGFDWICNPAASELEGIVMNWLGQLLALDDSFLSDKSETKGCGSIQSTASEGTLVSMIAARNRVLKKLNENPSFNDNESFRDTKKLVVYTSNQAHSSFVKAARILNIKIHNLNTDENGAVQPRFLEEQISLDIKQGLIPFYVGLCLGTTGVGAVDNIVDCLPVAKEYDLWVHVDAAWAGAYLMLPQYQVFNGFKGCDSIVFNPHKLMLTNFDCCALWTKNRFDLIEALSADASYYANFATQSGKVIDYKNLQVPLGRRFRSLKLWFVMRNYGAKGLRSLLENNLELTKQFVDLINRDGIFEITHPTTFSLVCFRMKPQTENESLDLTNRRNKYIYESISNEGDFLIGHSNFNSKYFFRVSIGNQHNNRTSVTNVYEKLKSLAIEVDQHIE